MGFLDSIGNGFKSLGNFVNDDIIHPFTNKIAEPFYNNVIKPVGNVVLRPVREISNIGSGIEKMTEVWEKRAGSLTNDTITAVDKGITGAGNIFQGFGNLFTTPIVPIALGLGAVYVLKK